MLAVSVVVSGCGGATSTTTSVLTEVPGADSAVEAVQQLVDMEGPDFGEVAHLAMPGQAALASLAEGASVADVAAAISDGDLDVAANFWAGFAQGSGGILSGGQVGEEGPAVEVDGVEFHQVTVIPTTGRERVIVLREADGYRVDLFASFGAGLAERMIEPVERLLVNQTAEARLVVAQLRAIVPSLKMAAQLPGTSSALAQQLLALVEVITRIG